MRFGRLVAFKDAAKAERAGNWLLAEFLGSDKAARYCEKAGIPVRKAMGESLNSAGGFIVPPELVGAIVDRREFYGVFRQTAQPAPMGSDLSSWPATGTGVTASWVAEGVAIAKSTPGSGMVGLVAQKLGALVEASSEIDEDAAVPLADWLADAMGNAFANKEDLAAFNGDGTSTYAGFTGITQGLLQAANSASKIVASSNHDTYAEIDSVDIGSLIAALPASAMPGAYWFISQYGFAATFVRLASIYGGISMAPDRAGIVRPWFAGFPVALTQVMPAVATDLSGSVMIAFGDMQRAAMLGELREFRLERAVDGPYFNSDVVAFRGAERVAINIHNLGDTTTAGPIVGLVGE